MDHEVAAAARYYSPLLRGRIARALRALRAKVSINDLAMSMGNARQARALLKRKDIEAALAPAARVIKDAVRQGGRIGAAKVRKLR